MKKGSSEWFEWVTPVQDNDVKAVRALVEAHRLDLTQVWAGHIHGWGPIGYSGHGTPLVR